MLRVRPLACMVDLSTEDGISHGCRNNGEVQPPRGLDGVYHEKQVGAVCAVHCLSKCMQASLFDEAGLSEAGQSLDCGSSASLGGALLEGLAEHGEMVSLTSRFTAPPC